MYEMFEKITNTFKAEMNKLMPKPASTNPFNMSKMAMWALGIVGVLIFSVVYLVFMHPLLCMAVGILFLGRKAGSK